MTSNTSNTSNSGNASNAGSAGNLGSGWYFADRVNYPFVNDMLDGVDTTPYQANKPYPDKYWGAYWKGWVLLTEFVQQVTWPSITCPDIAVSQQALAGSGLIGQATTDAEIAYLLDLARFDRADALEEILAQCNETISYFMGILGVSPQATPNTYALLNSASLIATFMALHYKNVFTRPRPSHLCPALLPPVEVPGHASYPSGHATQAHTMSGAMKLVLPASLQSHLPNDLDALAMRIARNREIAGFHYPSDSYAGRTLAANTLAAWNVPACSMFQGLLCKARPEWTDR